MEIRMWNTAVWLLALWPAGLCSSESPPPPPPPPPPPLFLAGHSFRLRSSLVSSSGSRVLQSLQVREAYSAGQRRARLDYSLDRRRPSQLFHDANQNWTILHQPDQHLCTGSSLDQIHRLLYANSSQTLGRLLADLPAEPHVLGPARLLFLVAQHASELQRHEELAEQQVRNHPALAMRLQLVAADGQPVELRAFYERAAMESQPDAAPSRLLPLRISLLFGSELDGQQIHVDFRQLELIADQQAQLETPNTRRLLSSGAQPDRFANPLTLNCSASLADERKLDPFARLDFSATRFSFTAHLDELRSAGLRLFAAYDGIGQLMRIDMRPSSEELASTELLDFRANRLMTISRQQCMLTYLSPDAQVTGGRLVADLLLGAHKFALMGRARVRGLEAQILEAELASDQLPVWLSPPLVYRGRDGKLKRRLHGSRLDEKQESSLVSPYSLTLYLSADSDGTELVRPLWLEIHRLDRLEAAHVHRRVLALDFHEFQWQLSAAPNGDSAHQLFTARSLCLDPDSRLQEVKLLLEPLDTNFNGGWIDDWTWRHSALAVALHDLMGEAGSMMYDLEASWTASRRNIQVSFRLAEHSKFVTELRFLGNTGVHLRSNKLIESSGRSPIDCLWMVDASRGPTLLGYSEAARTCFVDQTLDQLDSGQNKSQIFKLSPLYTNELYQVERRTEDSYASRQGFMLDARKLEGQLMVLQRIRSDVQRPLDPIQVKVRIKRVRHRELSHSRRVTGAHPVASSFAGFKLASQNNKKVTISEEDRTLTLAQCQAACMADLSCLSFSFCNNWPDTNCILSASNLSDSRVVEQLSKLNPSILSGGDRFDIDGDSGIIELIRDFRCELFARNHLNMFERSAGFEVESLRGHKLHLVSSEERCAELCFAQTVEALLLGNHVSSQIKQLITGGLPSDWDQIRDKVKHMHLDGQSPFKRMCHYFLYSELPLNQSAPDDPGVERSNSNARCLLSDSSSTNTASDTELIEPFEADHYRFDSSLLFEKHYGYRLADSDKTPEQRQAFKLLTSGDSASALDYQLVGQAIGDGKNFQITLDAKVAECARQCLMLSGGLWPACGSFDIIINNASVPLCVLNALSLGQVGQQDILRQQAGDKSMHFEPQLGFARQLTTQIFNISYALGTRGLFSEHESQQVASYWFSPSVLLCLTASLVSGIIVGIWLGTWTRPCPEGGGRSDGNDVVASHSVELIDSST